MDDIVSAPSGSDLWVGRGLLGHDRRRISEPLARSSSENQGDFADSNGANIGVDGFHIYAAPPRA